MRAVVTQLYSELLFIKTYIPSLLEESRPSSVLYKQSTCHNAQIHSNAKARSPIQIRTPNRLIDNSLFQSIPYPNSSTSLLGWCCWWFKCMYMAFGLDYLTLFDLATDGRVSYPGVFENFRHRGSLSRIDLEHAT
jgi:hypothetical protein